MTNSVYINNISVALPNSKVSNEQMEDVLGKVGGKRSRAKSIVLRSNGIKSRYYAIDPVTGEQNYTNASLAAEAVRGLFDDENSIENIDCLVAGTSIPDQVMPGHGVMIHGELKNPPCEVISTSGVCVCGVTALKYAFLNIKAGESSNNVAVASELASAVLRSDNFEAESQYKLDKLDAKPEIAFEKDFLRWMLSDGAGAVLVSDTANKEKLSLKIDWIDILSYADTMEPCMYTGAEKEEGKFQGWSRFSEKQRAQRSVMTIKQDVKLLNENIVKVTLEQALSEVAKKRKLNVEEIDYFLPHFSSNYFKEKVHAGLEKIGLPIPYEKWFTNLTEKGNTGSASIFIMLGELFDSGRLKDGQKLLCFIPESGRFSSAFIHLTAVEPA